MEEGEVRGKERGTVGQEIIHTIPSSHIVDGVLDGKVPPFHQVVIQDGL